MDLSALPLPPSRLALLHTAGYRKRSDLDGVIAATLAQKIGGTAAEAARLLANVHSGGSSSDDLGANYLRTSARTGLALLQEERAAQKIVTLVQPLDELLGGGVRPGQLTEVAGVPGVGKTQMGMQLAVNAAVPHALGGAGGETAYIDTEGSFSAQRVREMAEGLVGSLWQSLVACRPEERGAREEALRGLTCEGVLSGIHVFRCHDLAELVAAVKGLCAFAEGRSSRVRLVVVDSVAFHFRHENLPFARRLQLLGTVSQALLDFARAERAAAVLVNQVTTPPRHCLDISQRLPGRFLDTSSLANQVTTKVNDATNDSFLAPALGESWADCRTKRVLLEWQGFDGVVVYDRRTPATPS